MSIIMCHYPVVPNFKDDYIYYKINGTVYIRSPLVGNSSIYWSTQFNFIAKRKIKKLREQGLKVTKQEGHGEHINF